MKDVRPGILCIVIGPEPAIYRMRAQSGVQAKERQKKISA